MKKVYQQQVTNRMGKLSDGKRRGCAERVLGTGVLCSPFLVGPKDSGPVDLLFQLHSVLMGCSTVVLIP